MTSGFPYSEPLSHPPNGSDEGVRLTDHLEEVANRAEHLAPETTTPNGTPLSELGRITGLLHDIGKLTTYFQQYIAGNRDGDQKTYHAQLGAALTLYVLTKDDAYDVTDALIGFTSVAKHHGRLPNVVDYAVEGEDFFDRFHDHLITQTENIQSNAPDVAQSILDKTGTSVTFDGFQTALENNALVEPLDEEYVGLLFSSGGNDIHPRAHDALLALWSSLLVADKSSAANISTDALTTEPFSPDAIQSHIDTLWENKANWDSHTTKLNHARDTARQTAIETASTLPTDGAVATLTLPTGLGKTLTGTQAALMQLEQKRDDGYPGRLIYALPFTSIIDQTEEVFQKVFGSDPTTSDLTVHHSLAETVTRYASQNNTDEFAAHEYLLGETWLAGTVLTTYVQLLESLVAPTNSQALKLSSLYGSVIIFDEPQSIPADWWPLFRRLTTTLTKQFDATIILMTATQPRILSNSFDPIELVPDSDRYFTQFERVTYTCDKSITTNQPLSHDRAGTRIAKAISDGKDSVLSITNTIASTRTLYLETVKNLSNTHTPIKLGSVYETTLKNTTQEDSSPQVSDVVTAVLDCASTKDNPVIVCQLTTRHSSKDRKILLNSIIELMDSSFPVVLCSSQLVEAGVDISFETVYRDLAPLSSLVQAAGRCNRSFEWSQGAVILWHLESPSKTGLTPAKAVYGRGLNLIDRTQETLTNLTDGATVSEAELTTTGVRKYYTHLLSSHPGDEGLVEDFDKANCQSLQNTSLINSREAIDVFVVRTPAEQATVHTLQQAFSNRNYTAAKTLKQELASIRVSIPVSDSCDAEKLTQLPPIDPNDPKSTLRVLDVTTHERFFTAEAGVTLPDDSIEHRII